MMFCFQLLAALVLALHCFTEIMSWGRILGWSASMNLDFLTLVSWAYYKIAP